MYRDHLTALMIFAIILDFFFKKIDIAEFYNFLGIQFKGSEKGRLTVEL